MFSPYWTELSCRKTNETKTDDKCPRRCCTMCDKAWFTNNYLMTICTTQNIVLKNICCYQGFVHFDFDSHIV